ncbi:nucleolar protein 58-like isoform X1 [Mauremys reevesii]|uniref:nucleolar protein 58-like isoform X1 n=1 Tax=Mauremys reevesii TaxID=260615 RepID=UPI00193F6077|nr:nucleolar protein 58-like isoform X1 [Mauremys reevesii]
MNQLARHFWFTFSALSVTFPLHSDEVYSAPVRPYAELQKTILPALETDPVDLFPNYPDFASVDGTQHDTSVIWNLEPRSLSKRSINWNKVIPNRPALAEIVVVGSVSIILALLSGMVLWYFILKWTKEEKALTFGFRLLSKQIPFGILARGGEEWRGHEEGSAWQRRIEKFKGFDFSALKPKRKKKKVSKEDKKAKEMKEKQEKPPEEMSEKQGEKEKPPGEGKEKREKKPKVAKRQEKQKKLRKIKKTKSKLQLKHPKGKKSPSRKKLK